MFKENLEKIAFIDEKTGLRNRNGLMQDYIDSDLQNQHFIYIDIDDFKKMNFVFGRDTVDKIVIKVVNLLKDFCGNSELYRLGAGQFALVTESHYMCEPSTLHQVLIQPVVLDGLQIVVNASVCVIDHDDFPDLDLKHLIDLLQITIDVAKKNGKNQLVYANQETYNKYQEKISIADNLYKGVTNKEFYPKFQPFLDTYTNEVVGFEAVSRWNMNDIMLRPHCFLDAAEWTGLIYEIELQMFEEAVRFFRELKDNKSVKLNNRFKAAVHLSAYTLKRVQVSEFLEILEKYNISQKDIIIETHEKYILDQAAYEKIKEFRNNRFMILLDDYSNDNASLSFLADLKIDAMKMSETLMDKIDGDQEYTRMMNVYKFIVNIAKQFNITIVSDGINSKENAKLVKELDVNIGMGPYFSKAIPKAEFIEFLQNNKKKWFR